MTRFVIPAMRLHPSFCSRGKKRCLRRTGGFRSRTNEVREAKRRKARTTCRTNGCGASSAEDARLPALHRGACPGGLPPETQSRPRFTRRSAKALPSPGSPRLSEAPRVSVVVPRGSMPGPPGGRSDESPPAGTALAPSVGVTGDVPHEERDGAYLGELGILSRHGSKTFLRAQAVAVGVRYRSDQVRQ
jgi:hypothetical protein